MSVEENKQALLDRMRVKAEGRVSAKWRTIADVDWDDLEYFIDNCKRRQDKESFDTALRILQALRTQVLERK